MGLAVAKALSAQVWYVHLLDVNEERGLQAVDDLHPKATFHQTNVSVYHELATAFQAVFQRHRRLDFVFANAGVIERSNFYTHAFGHARDSGQDEEDDAPPAPDLRTLEVDLHGVVFSSSLAAHYFRRSPGQGHGTALVMTASCGGLYPSFYSPLYTAAKRESSFHWYYSDISHSWANPGPWHRRRGWLHARHRIQLLGSWHPGQRHLSRNRTNQPRRPQRLGDISLAAVYRTGNHCRDGFDADPSHSEARYYRDLC